MREQIQISLRIAAAFFLVWALALASDPMATHNLISTGPYDAVTHAMLSGSFLGFAVMLLLSASDPRDDITGAMAVMMIILAVISALSMAGSHAMPANFYTVVSLIFTTGMGAYLLVGQLQELFASNGGAKRPKARKAPAKKKPAKKAKKQAKRGQPRKRLKRRRQRKNGASYRLTI